MNAKESLKIEKQNPHFRVSLVMEHIFLAYCEGRFTLEETLDCIEHVEECVSREGLEALSLFERFLVHFASFVRVAIGQV